MGSVPGETTAETWFERIEADGARPKGCVLFESNLGA